MVNTTQFYKTKVALAVVLSLGLAACGDSEGDAGSTSTSTTAGATTDATQNTVGNQEGLSGTVQGVVVNTNGTPMEGVMVYLGSESTTTNAGGQYVFTDVAVTNVSGVNNEGDETIDPVASTLVVTIGGTDTYLGALVTVTPQAQVNNTGGQGDGQSGGNSDTTIQTFIDGFTAQAGTAVLPMLNAGAYGYIRDCDTDIQMTEMADLLSLDFVTANGSTNDVTTAVAGNGVQVTNAEHGVDFGSDADGEFSLMNLAANSTYTISAKQGWEISDASDATNSSLTFTTNSEGSSEFLGTIEVCPVEFVDTIPGPAAPAAPYIDSIDGQIGTSELAGDGNSTYTFLGDHDDDALTPDTLALEVLNYAALNQGVVNDFVINFSEEMASTFNMAEARVKVDGASVLDATVTLSAEGDSVTVTFADDLPEGSKVDVWFPYWLATDANDALFLVNNTDIGYDAVAVETTSKALYAHAFFCTFEKPVDEATVVLGPQVIDADTSEDGASADLAGYSTAFQDNIDGGPAITQLNDGDAMSGTRLEALALARGVTVTVDQDYAVVEYDGSNAASLIWSPTPTATIANVEAHYDGTAHGTTVSVTPVNGFGDVITSGKMSFTLLDAIAPTTVLQESYNITDATPATGTAAPRTGQDVVTGTTGNAAFGNGGEISLGGSAGTSVGNPIIHVQPRHLAGQVSGAAVRNTELDSLTGGMSARLSAAELTAFGPGAGTALSQSTIAGHEMPVYDATAIAAWAATPGTIGVAFNEDATVTAVAPVFDGSTTLSGYAALNNVAADVDGNVVAVDLVTFATPDVVALSLDAGADLSFVGAVTDSRGNAATANAQVFIQDTFPPMMTAAVWDGDTLELTFNEPVVIPAAGTSITIIDPETTTNSLTIALTTTNAVASGNTLSITLTGGQNTTMAPLFVDGAGGEFLYDAIGTATEEQHALIDWDNIADATGNEWSEFNPTLSSSNRGMESAPIVFDTRRWEVVAPRFLVVNSVGPFTYSVATAGFDDGGVGGDDDGAVTFTITFTHPIDLSLGNAFSNAIDAADTIATPDPITNLSYSTANAAGTAVLNALFTMDLDGDSVVDANDSFSTGVVSATVTNGSLAISAGNTTLTLTIGAAVESIVFNTSDFGFATTTTSAINGLQTSAGNFPWQNTN
jgi:hypothetical protein